MSNKYEALLSAMDEGYFLAEVIFDAQGEPFDMLYLEANPAAVRMAGTEIAGRHERELNPAPETHWYEVFGRVAKTGVPERHELPVAGRKAFYAVHAFTIGAADGRTVAAIFKDITRSKEVEETLRKSEEAFRAIANAAPAFIWVGNAEGESVFMSDSWYAYSGLSEAETKNGSWARALYPDDLEPMLAAWDRSRSTGAPYEIEVRCRRKDGQYRWHHFRALPRRNAEGRIEAWYGISIDIHDRKMAEEALRNREAELAHAQRIGGIASIDILVTGDIEDSVSWRSLEYRELHGLLQGIVYETHYDWLRRVHPSDRRKAEQALKSALAGSGKIYQGEYRIIRPIDGQVRWIYAKVDIERNEQGKATRLIGAHIDITDRKRAERAAQKAEQKYRLELEHEVRLRTAELKEQAHLVQRITETMPDLVSIMEWPSRKLTYANRDHFLAQGFDLGPMSNAQENRLRYTYPEDVTVLDYYYSRFASLPDGGIVTADYRARNNSGKWMWYRVRGKVFQRDADGKVLQIINVIQDITALKQAELEIREGRQKLEAAFDVSTTFLCVLRAVRNKEGRLRAFNYEWGNKAANKIAHSHAKRMRLLSSFPVSDRKALFDAFVKTVETGAAAEFEDKYHIDEHNLWFRWKIVKYDDGVLVSIEDITEKHNAEQDLMRLKMEQQREVLSTIIVTEEKERERIGEALHNGVAQLLYAIQTRLQLVQAASGSGQKHLKEALAITNEAIKDTRRISFELVPAVLKDYGIEVAIRSMISKVVAEPLHADLRVSGLRRRLPEKIEFAIYRIVQEMVNNILKHAQATEALVEIDVTDECISLDITDNGIGFKEAELSDTRKGIGLQSARNRVSLLDGSFSIRSDSSGTHVQIVLPL